MTDLHKSPKASIILELNNMLGYSGDLTAIKYA